MAEAPNTVPPKLLICGHGSVDDPDGGHIYDEIIEYLETKVPHIRHLICAMRVRPSDQVLNAILSKATIALQLSTSEGFEVKVSEAIHKGKPVIATRAGGIPLQVTHGKNGSWLILAIQMLWPSACLSSGRITICTPACRSTASIT